MISLVDFLSESLENAKFILERNEKMFPKGQDQSKFEIWVGDHCKQRQQERNISDKEIVSALFAAWPELNKKYKEREFEAAKQASDTKDILIIDAREDRQNPLTISCFLYRNRSNNKLYHPAFTVKTVYKDVGGAKKTKEGIVKIFLY